MTLNSILARIRTIALAHRLIRRFTIAGHESDFFADKTAKYPACCLQYTTGNISITDAATTISFRMYVLDMVHVSEDTKANEEDVLSDTLSTIIDLVAQMNSSEWTDWRMSLGNNLQALTEYDNDLIAGWHVEFSLKTPFKQNLCEIPSDLSQTDNEDMKLVYDKKYIADGTEGSTLTIPEIAGMKILLVTREMAPLHRVSSSPDPAEFTWNDVSIGLGTPVNQPIDGKGERFLILYRIY